MDACADESLYHFTATVSANTSEQTIIKNCDVKNLPSAFKVLLRMDKIQHCIILCRSPLRVEASRIHQEVGKGSAANSRTQISVICCLRILLYSVLSERVVTCCPHLDLFLKTLWHHRPPLAVQLLRI